MRRLAVTPAPITGELVGSYLLRLSEANGFRTPHEICKRLRPHDPYRSSVVLAFGAEDLSRLVGWSLETLRGLGQPLGACMAAFRTVRGDVLLAGVDRRPIGSPMVCPKCIEENGWADASWGLSLVRACPIHRMFGVTACGKCGKPLTWDRALMGACDCGYPIRDGNDVDPEEEELAAVGMLRSFFLPNVANLQIAERIGFPVEDLQRLSLPELTTLFRNLAALTFSTRYSVKDRRPSDALNAARVLADWPERLIELLETYNRSLSQDELLRLLFRGPLLSPARIKSLGNGDSFRFISKATQLFLERNDLAYLIDPRYAKRFGWCSPWMSANIAAQNLRVDCRSVRALARAGKIPVKRSGRKIFVRLDSNVEEIARSWSRIDERKAAAIMGLPVRTLRDCVKTNVLPNLAAVQRRGGFSALRVNSARQHLDCIASKNPVGTCKPTLPWRMRDIMRSARFTTKTKVALVQLALDQNLPVVQSSDQFLDLKIDMGRVLIEYRATGAPRKGWVAYGWVPHTLFCSYYGPGELARRGLLQDCKIRMFRYISLRSLEQFRRKYVSAAELGMALGASAKRMAVLCQKAIPIARLLVLPPPMGTFIRRSDLSKLEVAFGKLPFNKLVEIELARPDSRRS